MKNIKIHITTIVLLLSISTSSSSLATDKNPTTLTWAGCGITKKAFMAELASAYEKKTGIKILLQGGGATRGIRDTVHQQKDMGGSCRMNLPGEDRAELHASMHPVAWDALAVITHKSNPVKNLSSEQIRQIYMGRITSWRQLGGQHGPVHLYVRRGKISGVGYAIRQYLFRNSSAEFITHKDYIMRSSGPLEKAIEQDKYGIAITGISSARKRNVRIIALDHKQPTYENVMRGKYDLYRPLYLVTTPTPPDKVRDFVSFAMSKEGRDIIRKNGTVPYRDAPQLMSKMLIYGFDVQ